MIANRLTKVIQLNSLILNYKFQVRFYSSTKVQNYSQLQISAELAIVSASGGTYELHFIVPTFSRIVAIPANSSILRVTDHVLSKILVVYLTTFITTPNSNGIWTDLRRTEIITCFTVAITGRVVPVKPFSWTQVQAYCSSHVSDTTRWTQKPYSIVLTESIVLIAVLTNKSYLRFAVDGKYLTCTCM